MSDILKRTAERFDERQSRTEELVLGTVGATLFRSAPDMFSALVKIDQMITDWDNDVEGSPNTFDMTYDIKNIVRDALKALIDQLPNHSGGE